MWILRWEIKLSVGSSSNNLRGNSLGYFLFLRAFSPHPPWPDRIIFPVIFRVLRNCMCISEMEKKRDWPRGWHVSAYRSHLDRSRGQWRWERGDLDCGTDLLKEKSLSLVQWALIPLYPGPESHVSFCWKEWSWGSLFSTKYYLLAELRAGQ